AIGVIIAVQAFGPFGAKSLFAVKEDEPVGEFSFLTMLLIFRRHDASDFEQRAGARPAVVRADKGEFFEGLRVVMAGDDDDVRSLAGKLGDDVFEFNIAMRGLFGELFESRFQAVTLKLANDVLTRFFVRGRARGARAKFDLRLDVIECALAVERGRLFRLDRLPALISLLSRRVFNRRLRGVVAVGAGESKRGGQRQRQIADYLIADWDSGIADWKHKFPDYGLRIADM